MIKACIFDLDGVIVDTAKYHFIAWRRLANELGFDFDEKKNEKLKGVSRMGSLELILKWGGVELSEEEKQEWADKKNSWYREFILNMDPDEILEGVLPFLDHLEEKGIKMGVGSGSKNAPDILRQIELYDHFDSIIDGAKTTKSKPDPQVFELGAEELGVKPYECIVFEDAEKGIDAAIAGNFYAVGVGEEDNLGHAHMVIPDFIGLELEDILEVINEKSV